MNHFETGKKKKRGGKVRPATILCEEETFCAFRRDGGLFLRF